jgi:peptidoglycan/LPS O-acetylase OafA/YrhL
VSIAVARLVSSDLLVGADRQAIGAVTFSSNWLEVSAGSDYFDATSPALFVTFWSLAVEEQFYLFWPIVLVGLLSLTHRAGARVWLATGLAAVSAILIAARFVPGANPTRVYYGTDTHASGLLIGAALAVMWPPWRLSTKTGPRAPLALEAAGFFGLATLVWCFMNVSEFDAGLYRGGYLAFALLSALVIAVVVHPAVRLSSGVLGLAALRWVGQRSYGIYLWHWPVYLVTRPDVDVPMSGIPLFVFRVAITVGIAAASYRYVEMPIRSGALGRRLEALRRSPRLHRQHVAKGLGFVGGCALIGAVLVGVGLAAADPASPPRGFPRENARIAIKSAKAAASSTTTTTPSATTTAPATTALPALGGRVTAVGDSVMLGAQRALQQFLGDRLQMDASVSRHTPEAIDVIRRLRDAGMLGDEFVLHLGTNGTLDDAQFEEIMQLLSGLKRVVVVNARVDRPWVPQVNETMAAGVRRHPNAVLFDWHAAANEHPEFFVADGVHLTGDGARYYALLISSKL